MTSTAETWNEPVVASRSKPASCQARQTPAPLLKVISSGPHDVMPELASLGLKRGDSGALHPTGKSYEESV